MTDEEANEKWCPFVRYRYPDSEQVGNRDRKDDNPAYAACIAWGCMMWVKINDEEGYCGLVNK